MSEASIPVDLFNPGQVFACLGLLELADILCGNSQGAFDWNGSANAEFHLFTEGVSNSLTEVLSQLANAEIVEIEPHGWLGESSPTSVCSEIFPSPLEQHQDAEGECKRSKLPISIGFNDPSSKRFAVEHWCDYSSRPDFKLYAGNRSGYTIARDMIQGKWTKPSKNGARKLLNPGIAQLWKNNREAMLISPFEILAPMAGSFNMDARGAWSPIDAGYSPDKQKHSLQASPLVEMLAVLGLEHCRPPEMKRSTYQVHTWREPLYPALARVAIQGSLKCIESRTFQFALRLSGKNKIVSMSEEIAH